MPLTALLLSLAWTPSALAHGGATPSPADAPSPAEAPEVPLGERDVGEVHLVATAAMGDPVEVTFALHRRLDPPDPLLGALAPVTGASVSVTLLGGPRPVGPLPAHPEGEAGVYGVHFPGLPDGAYAVEVMVMDGGVPMTVASFPLDVTAAHPAHAGAAMGHHAMTHPFLSHMGIPDGPGETSVRATLIRRAEGDLQGSDAAFHVEAGIVPRLGLHLRNDAITGNASTENGHGTELMLMYAVLQDEAATRGVSVFAETALPTVVGDGAGAAVGIGAGARYMWKTRLLLDGIVHVDPMEGLAMLGVEYEGSLQVRVAGRVFLLLEDSGEAGAMGKTNALLPAVKVGLGETGGAIGAGVQLALLAERAWDRQAMFQLDWAF